MSTKTVSTITELIVALRLQKLGFYVSVPFGDFLPYDLVVDNGQLFRIQVKTAYIEEREKRQDIYKVKTSSNWLKSSGSVNKQYRLTDFDFTVVYIPDLDICYVYSSVDFLSRKQSITIDVNIPSNNRENWTLA
jgi:hypothetical protein